MSSQIYSAPVPQNASQADMMDIARKKKIAEMLMQMGQRQQDPNQMAGRTIVPISPLAALAPILQTGAGVYADKQADTQAAGVATRQQKLLGDWLQNMPQQDELQPVMPFGGFKDPNNQQGYNQAQQATNDELNRRKLGWALQGQQLGGAGAEIGTKMATDALKTPDAYTLSPGATRYDGNNNPIASVPKDPNAHTGSQSPLVQAYNIAKDQGYKGSLLQFQKELSNAQANYPYTVAQINGVPTLVDRTTGQPIGGGGLMPNSPAPQPAGAATQPVTGATPISPPAMAPRTIPLTTLDQQGAGENEVKRQQAEGSALGEAQGKIAGGIQTKGANADVVTSLLDEAGSLIPKATGSRIGSGVDAVEGIFGATNEGAKSIASLKVIQSGLMANMPRMEGPQSDRDVQMYREAAGQIGDPNVPNELKQAAVDTIRSIQQKYQQRAAGAGAPAAVGVPTPGGQQPEQTATGPNGQKIVLRNGQWVPM
jgi:hypothetical protein